MSPSFDNLPSTALLHICEYLDRDHTSSLVAFARASKSCHAAATVLLFRTIKLPVSSLSQIIDDVQRHQSMLQRAQGFGRVHRLIIDAAWPQDDPHRQKSSSKLCPEERGYPTRFFDTDGIQRHVFGADMTPVSAIYTTNSAWLPLADLIKQLPALQDLVYGFPGQFPPCLLEVLHKNLPRCKLHLNTFKLRSLNAKQTDPYEFKLATSPNLQSVSVDCAITAMQHGGITRKVQDFNCEAVQGMVTGLASGLREVRILHSGWVATRDLYEFSEKWKGFTYGKQGKSSKRMGSLKYLEIKIGDYLIEVSLIQTWKTRTDFSVLETLKLESHIAQDTLEFLAASSGFPSLKNLVLRLAGRYMGGRQPNGFFDTARRFLLQVPPLESLELMGELSHLDMGEIIEYHGSALRQLFLSPSDGDARLMPENITKIGAHCPLLEDLVLKLWRSKGDGTEAASYRALGSIKRLQHLSLNLDASNHAVLLRPAVTGFDDEDDDVDYSETPNDSSFDSFDQQVFGRGYLTLRDPRNGHIKDAFINSALDETLARAIFSAISGGKAEGSLPLKKMRIRVSGGARLANWIHFESVESVELVVREVGRSWLCERNERDDRRNEVIVKEAGPRGRGTQQEKLSKDVEPIFRRLWPAMEKVDWRDEWSSFPLQTSDA